MPRRNHILVIAGIALAIVAGALFVLTRSGGDDRRDRDREHTREGASTNANDTSTSANGTSANGTSANGTNASGSSGAIPLEAMPQLAEAIQSSHFQDAVELCSAPATLAAHRGDCTIAACRAHFEGKARSWFANVDEADQARVAKACEDAKISLAPRERPERPHPHRPGRRGASDVD